MSADASARLRGSVRATFLATVVSGVIQAATMVVLARLLGPRDYGFFAVCLAINALSVAFFASALERALVIYPDANAVHGRTPLVLGFLVAVAALTFASCAGVRAATGWQVDLRVLAIVLAAQAFAGLALVPRALLRRELRFGRIVGGEVCGQFVGSFAIAALLARAGFGPFALAFGNAALQLLVTGWVLASAPRDRWRLNVRDLRDLLRTAGGVIKVVSVEALHSQLTPLVVTGALGAVALGLFNRVYTLVTLPIQLLVSSANRVMISGMVAVTEDPVRWRNATRRLVRMVSTIITPVAFGVAGASEPFVAVVLGDRWLAAVGVVPLLCVAVVANMLGGVLATLAEAARRFNDKVRAQLSATAVLVAALAIGGHWGLSGVAWGVMVGGLAFFLLYLRLTVRLVGVPLHEMVRWLAPSWITGAGCWLAATLAGRLLVGHTPMVLLVGQITVCAGTAALLLMLLDRATLADLAELALGRRVRGARPS